MTDVWEFLDTEAQGADEVRALANWATNYDAGRSPFGVFLDLIGWSEDNLGESLVPNPSSVIGYLEADYLADALKEYAHNPSAVMSWIGDLMEAEANG
jgi:hypothetical protein